jgi:hypothetical protein
MNRMRRPFWLPASNYYVLAVAIAMAFFFVVWGVLDDIDGVRAPWQTAGVSASVVLVGAVILREMILRRTKAYIRQPIPQRLNDPHKLSVDRAAIILAEIKKKSDAANVLDKIASGHREVYELCAAFLERIDVELATVQPGSPRLAALLRSRNKASALHRSHTLRWAEIQSKLFSSDARSLPEPTERLRAAHEAVSVVEQALVAYPAEEALIESRAVLTELALSILVANTVEQARWSASQGDIPGANQLYHQALVHLGQGGFETRERLHAAERIQEAIDQLPFSRDNR